MTCFSWWMETPVRTSFLALRGLGRQKPSWKPLLAFLQCLRVWAVIRDVLIRTSVVEGVLGGFPRHLRSNHDCTLFFFFWSNRYILVHLVSLRTVSIVFLLVEGPNLAHFMFISVYFGAIFRNPSQIGKKESSKLCGCGFYAFLLGFS